MYPSAGCWVENEKTPSMRVTHSHRRHFVCTIRILLRLSCLHGVISKDSFNVINRQKRFCKKVGKTPLSKTPFFGANPTANPTGFFGCFILPQKVRKTPDFLSKSGVLLVVSRVMRKIDSGIWQKSITGGGLTAPWLLHKRAGRKGSRAAVRRSSCP